MKCAAPDPGSARVVEVEGLGALLRTLLELGYQIIGPTLRDGAIVYDRIESVADLPAGLTDDQEAGRYRTRRRADGALFGYASAADTWKTHLRPAAERLVRVTRREESLHIASTSEPAPRLALVGVRSCDLSALAILDRVLTDGPSPDPRWHARREGLFIVAVSCSEPASTCFCASMGTGPRPDGGFDLHLTELLEPEHRFLVERGSVRGGEVLERLPHRPATPEDLEAARLSETRARSAFKRSIDLEGLKERIYAAAGDRRWEQVATRCLACANCTMVCPTCFCSTIEDTSDVGLHGAERWRRWDSCFTLGFSYIHGGSVRTSIAARYRQWLTHKLASWQDQFGTPGCVGCGRCITWCPAAIDITEESARTTGASAASSAHAGSET